MKRLAAVAVTLGLAVAIHLDWHVARPAEHHLSLGWGWHWLLAIPVFALTAWYVHRSWPARPIAASVTILGIAAILGGLCEPAWEYWVDGAPYEWAFGRIRLVALGKFLLTGILTHAVVLTVLRRRVRPAAVWLLAVAALAFPAGAQGQPNPAAPLFPRPSPRALLP